MFYHCDRLDYFMSHWFHNHLARPMIKLFPRTYWRKAIRNSRSALPSSITDCHDEKLCSMLVLLPFASLVGITMGILKLLFPFLDVRSFFDTIFYWIMWGVFGLIITSVVNNKVEMTDKERKVLVQKCMKKDKKWHLKWKLIIFIYTVLSLYFAFYVSVKFMSWANCFN